MTGDWAGFYDSLAADYDDATATDGWRMNDDAARLLGSLDLSPTRVLDLGAGTGQTSTMLRELYGPVDLTLVDPSERMLEVARAKALGDLVVDDAVGFLRRTTERWDLVVAVGFLELMPDVSGLLRLAASRLTSGGHLLVSHEPLLDTGVQASPVSRIRGGLAVHRRSSAELERTAAAYGLVRATAEEIPAFERTDGDGPALQEIVVWSVAGVG